MKKLFLVGLMLLCLTGCSKFSANTIYGQAMVEEGNKIYAFQDLDTKVDGTKDKTTIVVVRVDSEATKGDMKAMMKHIKDIFLGTNSEEKL